MIKNASQFNDYLLKNYNKDTDEWYLLEVDVQYSKHMTFSMICNFHLKEWKLKRLKNLY